MNMNEYPSRYSVEAQNYVLGWARTKDEAERLLKTEKESGWGKKYPADTLVIVDHAGFGKILDGSDHEES